VHAESSSWLGLQSWDPCPYGVEQMPRAGSPNVDLGEHMLFEVEFLRFTEKAPEGELLRRVVGAFANLKAVEHTALIEASNARPMADGFRIYSEGMLSKTVVIRSMQHQQVA
jgi:hypothetical protein